METVDLDIDNYDLDDILKLFNLSYNFTQADLKIAQRKALQTHPDKSRLPSNYFIFFMKAYKLLSKIYYFRFKKGKSTNYDTDINQEQRILLGNIEKKDFNQWFNKMFERVKIKDNDQDSGYEQWFRSDADIKELKRVPFSQFGQEFEKHKRECKQLVVQKELTEMGDAKGFNLLREKPTSYSSSVFSKLGYEDLKKAHTETVVPVTQEDYLKKPKFTNIESYRSYRDGQNTAPPSLEQSRRFLAEKIKTTSEGDVRRIYGILKQDEDIAKSNEKWWASIKQLKNQ